MTEKAETAKITFYGGAGTVTGANFLFDTGETKLLIDCGAHERENLCDPRNREPFPYDVKAVDAAVVTHAHQDHIGLIPKLVREGFRGAIHSTHATRDLAAVMFADALSVMAHESEKGGCAPLYGEADVQATLSLWVGHEYHEPFVIGDARIELLDAGHILGSAMVKMRRCAGSSVLGSLSAAAAAALPLGPSACETPQNTVARAAPPAIIFTGDLGNSPEPLLNDTESPEGARYLVIESVYGDRLHEEREQRANILRDAIERARERTGTLLIPSFSLERTQIILFEIRRMIEEGLMQPIPIYLDAPLSQRVGEVFKKYTKLMNTEAQEAFAHGDALSFPGLVEVIEPNESHHLHRKQDPKVIVAGAGMSSGGRIRTHEKAYLPDKNASILLTGYQAPGSLGRRIQDGAREVEIDGARIAVRARVSSLTGYSGHADRDQLMAFVEQAGPSLEKVFTVMGEPAASSFLAQRIRDFLGVEALAPQKGESVMIRW